MMEVESGHFQFAAIYLDIIVPGCQTFNSLQLDFPASPKTYKVVILEMEIQRH